MALHPVLLRSSCAIALVAAAVALAPAARAQTPSGLATEFRLLNGMEDGSNSGDARFADGWVTAAPLITHGANTVTNSLGMSSSSDFTATADYGELRFYGSGAASTVPGHGCYLAVDDWIGFRPRAEFTDRIYLTSSVLPTGAPVTLRFQLTQSGSVIINDGYPILSESAELDAKDAAHVSPVQLISGGPGVWTLDFPSTVGDSVDLHGFLNVSFYCDGIRTAASMAASVTADVRVQTSVMSMTPGVVVSYGSHTVDVPPSTAPLALALDGAQPNPARASRVAIHFALASDRAATLTLYDIGGRVVASAEVGSFGEGSHVVDVARGRALAPGVYLVRLAQGFESRTARVAVIP
jgi:hypothetical protein